MPLWVECPLKTCSTYPKRQHWGYSRTLTIRSLLVYCPYLSCLFYHQYQPQTVLVALPWNLTHGRYFLTNVDLLWRFEKKKPCKSLADVKQGQLTKVNLFLVRTHSKNTPLIKHLYLVDSINGEFSDKKKPKTFAHMVFYVVIYCAIQCHDKSEFVY